MSEMAANESKSDVLDSKDTNPDDGKRRAAESDKPARKRGRSFVRRCLSFSLRDLMWLSLLSAVLILWYGDHQRLRQEYGIDRARDSWSVRQILGAPNTPVPGDQPTAWASQTQDGIKEWVIVEFPWASNLSKVEIVETYNPGAVDRICSVNSAGTETEIWRGVDPTPSTVPMGRSMFTISKPIRTRRIKIYLDSPKVPGWNEIDAVALHDRDGSVLWASNAWASSAFGDNQKLPSWFWP